MAGVYPPGQRREVGTEDLGTPSALQLPSPEQNSGRLSQSEEPQRHGRLIRVKRAIESELERELFHCDISVGTSYAMGKRNM